MATGLCGTCGGSIPGCGCFVAAGSGLVVSGDGSSGSPFTLTAKNREQLANPIRNASMHVTQRGASVAPAAAGGTTLDGWIGFRTGAVAGLTVSQQVAAGDALGAAYCARVQRDSGNASTAVTALMQSIPTVDSRRFNGRQMTLSFRARAGALYSAASSILVATIFSGTGVDQSILSGFTSQATVIAQNNTLTTSWQTFTVTATPATAQLAIQFSFAPVGTAGATDYFEIKDVRIDAGPYAIEHVPRPYAADLAECQRFFYRQGGVATSDFHGCGFVVSTTAAHLPVRLPVTMRAVPTLTASAAGGLVVNDVGAAPVSTAIAGASTAIQTNNVYVVSVTCGAGGLTVGRGCMVHTGGTAANGILDFSAEI